MTIGAAQGMSGALPPPNLPPRVLLAEDDEEMRILVALALRRDGWEVIEARDGRQLLALVQTHLVFDSSKPGIDLIVSDIRMPGTTGIEILAGIRGLQMRVPIILMTAFGDAPTRARAEALGAILFAKPFDLDDLRTAVANLRRRPH